MKEARLPAFLVAPKAMQIMESRFLFLMFIFFFHGCMT